MAPSSALTTRRPFHAFLLAASVFTLRPPARADEFFLKGGETIVFIGDSITQAGLYVEYIEAFLAARFPEKRFQVVYAGLSSETVSGTSEPGHDPPRPCVHDRFERDVAARNPGVVVACYGMNDGNYHPFEPQRLARFQAGVTRLIERIRTETRARLTLVTPPPFDPYRRVASDPNAVHFGYKFPAVDYDETLRRYGEWLLTLREKEQIPVADAHGLLGEHLRRRRAARVSFFLADDGVHPGPTGHWLIAQAILQAWNAPPAPVEVPPVLAGAGDELRWKWKASVPMPVDPRWDRESVALEGLRDGLNRHRLIVKGAPPGRHELRVNGAVVLETTRPDLERGIDLLDLPDFPTVKRSREILELVKAKRRERGRRPELDARIREVSQPVELEMCLVPRRDLDLRSRIGVNIHFTGAPAAELDAIRDAGLGWVRMDFVWEAVEHEKGTYRFEEYDALVEGLAARGLRALFILDYANKLYEEERSVRTGAGRAAFARFAGAAASRYRGRGLRWEIWNEPNLEQFWKPEPSPDEYAALAIEAAQAIRAADPAARILAPASSGFPWTFLERIFEKGLLQHVDEVSVHPYRSAAPETVRGDYARLRELIARHAPPAKRAIVSGEWGYSNWHHGGVPISEELQAAYAVRQMLTNASEGIALSIWYDWMNDGPDPREAEHNFGLVTRERKPKAAYTALQAFTGAIGGLAFTRRLEVGPEAHYLVFGDPSGEDPKRTLAYWTEGEPHRAALLRPGARSALELRAMPEILSLPGGDEGLIVHGLRVEPQADRLRVKVYRHGPGKGEGSLLIQFGEGALAQRILLDVALDGPETTREISIDWIDPVAVPVDASLRDASGLLAAFPQRSFLFPRAFRDVTRNGSLEGFTAATDGDPKVDGAVALIAGTAPELGVKPPRSLGVEYRFGKGWKFASVAAVPGFEEIPGKPRSFLVWVKGDGRGDTLRCRFKDSNGEMFQATAGTISWTGWKDVSIPLDGSGTKSWGEGGDGRVDYPIVWDAVFIIDSTREGHSGLIEFACPFLVYDGEQA